MPPRHVALRRKRPLSLDDAGRKALQIVVLAAGAADYLTRDVSAVRQPEHGAGSLG